MIETGLKCTTVGGHIESSHLKPSKIGDVVKAEAEVTKVDGKKIEFQGVGSNDYRRMKHKGIICGILAAVCYGTNPLGALPL